MKRILIMFVLMLLLASCSMTAKKPSIFSDKLCGKGCWNNIVVGKTTKEELLQIISSLPNVKPETIVVSETNGPLFDGDISFVFNLDPDNEKSAIYISAFVIDQIVVFIIFQGDLGLTIKNATQEFGEPEWASSVWTFSDDVNVSFINSMEGVRFVCNFENKNSSILPNTEVHNLSIFDTTLYETFLKANWLNPGYKDFIRYPWTGYGKIEEFYWPPY